MAAWFAWFGAFAAGPRSFAKSRLNLLGAPGSEPNFTLPLFPVTVEILDKTENGPRSDGLCSSATLRERLHRRAFLWLAGDPAVTWRADLILECRDLQGEGKVHVALFWPDRQKIYGFKVPRIGGSDGDDLASRTIAINLAMNEEKVAAPALTAFMAANLRHFTEEGARKLQEGAWDEAAELLHLALESPVEPPALYFGLAKAYAGLGLADQAYWYFAAYLESSRQDPEDVADKAREVLKAIADAPARAPRDGEIAGRWRAAAGAEDWNDALVLQKTLALETPWDEALYQRTADAYQKLGWSALEDNWRRRQKGARSVNTGRARMERLQQLVAAP
ncbi:MAG: hypothetical protein HYV14_10490 [Elusimicrobia bacterium]|nr:hypothetical protein [Elusimicrobiota bacterium]